MGQKKQENGQSEINFTISDISAIINMLKDNEIFEFCLEKGADRLWLKRGTEPSTFSLQKFHGSQEVAIATEDEKIVKLPVQVVSPEINQTPTPTPPALTTKMIDIVSPMVGTFYSRPAVDAEPYVEVGDTIKKGDVLCIVEAMKIMNEIEADVSGKIVEVCLDDGQMAEYGEVLFRIEPNS